MPVVAPSAPSSDYRLTTRCGGVGHEQRWQRYLNRKRTPARLTRLSNLNPVVKTFGEGSIDPKAKSEWWTGLDLNQRRQSQRIYSPYLTRFLALLDWAPKMIPA